MASSEMTAAFHDGERAVQARAGVAAQAARVASIYHQALPPLARAFLDGPRLIGVTFVDAAGWPRARLIAGERVVSAVSDNEIVLALPPGLDIAPSERSVGGPIGLIVMEPARRMRMRINGTVLEEEVMAKPGRLHIRTAEVYSNCARNIHRRTPPASIPPIPIHRELLDELESAAIETIQRTETYFLHSAHANATATADASHRGGPVGDLRIENGRLRFPDYAGNNLFNTLGNLDQDARMTVSVPDFRHGDVLVLSGHAAIHWDSTVAEAYEDAERVVEMSIEQIERHHAAVGAGWRDL